MASGNKMGWKKEKKKGEVRRIESFGDVIKF
jgi:hypothetical protein